MKAKYKFQVIQDTLMLIILLSLMGFHLWDENIHEWLGVIFFFIILLHNGLNTHWFKKLTQGEYSAFRILQVATNMLLMITLLAAIVSGILLSRHVFPDLPIHSTSDFVRKIHMTSVHWVQVIIALHLGLHWKMLANFFCKIWNILPTSLFATKIMPLIFIMTSLYGLHVFIHRDMLPYLLIQVDFAFFDFEESKSLFYWDFFAVIIFFSYLTRYLSWLLFFRRKSTEGNKV
ncbi:DUF4405 domain-containing protein [Pectobacterium carotovorum subsp. carotovorum]|nr:DUF4405 domain-containing protein [Pectobacterium carotovorum]MCL6333524.1 DUF4405 domain-containing protein [Pectobacterium carotovorum subsp. carotovorum]MCL6345256.1 DUF4405 domain-containing protein [Pectobacterium carotovorum subsp. carotovorum]MCL6400983.1 DUF4405 domain-containing protein [Pectobacterium carotovorum subsp. carotovorum]